MFHQAVPMGSVPRIPVTGEKAVRMLGPTAARAEDIQSFKITQGTPHDFQS
jgi:hypothetical protein